MSIDRGMAKEGVCKYIYIYIYIYIYTHTYAHTHIHIYTRILENYSAIKKNEIMPFAVTWVDLEIIMLSEVKQRKTNIIWYHLYVELEKNDKNQLIYKRETGPQT